MKLLRFISIVLTFLLCTIQLQGVQDFGAVRFVLFIIWFIVVSFSYSKIIVPVLLQRRFLSLYCFALFYFISSSFSIPLSTSFNRCIGFLSTTSPILMFELLKHWPRSRKIFFLLFISLVFLVNFYLAFQFVNVMNVSSLRYAHEFGEEFYVIMIAFNMCYAISLALPSICGLFYETKGRFLLRVLVLFVIISLFVFLFNAQFMTAILVATIGVFLEVIYRKKLNIIVTSFLCLIICVISFYIFLPFVIEQLRENRDYEVVTRRLMEINSVMLGKENQAEDMGARQDLNMMSVLTFIDNPIIGVNHRINPNIHVNEQGIGNHATWFDTLAKYGIFSIFMFFFIFSSLKKQKKEICSPVTMIMFIVLGFLNPLWLYPQIFSAFLFCPLLNCIMKKEQPQSCLVCPKQYKSL